MKPGDLVQVTLRRRGVLGPLPVGILVDIRDREYPLQDERELDCVVVVDGQERHVYKMWLRMVTEEIDSPMESP